MYVLFDCPFSLRSKMQGFILLVIFVTVSQTTGEQLARMCDVRYCQCAKDAGTLVTAKCTLDNIEDLKKFIQTPNRVSSL